MSKVVVLSVMFLLISLPAFCTANTKLLKQEVGVLMRLIGHELLLDSDDEHSRVLPVKQVGHRYEVNFDGDLHFDPGRLVYIVDSIMVFSDLAESYLIELQKCGEKEVMYAYQVNSPGSPDVIPCGMREYEKMCYTLFITIVHYGEKFRSIEEWKEEDLAQETSSSFKQKNGALLVLPFLILAGAGVYFWKRKEEKPKSDHIISLGLFSFDKRNMKLVLDEIETDLTGKEVDLLLLLYSNVNETVERDEILNKVWGDEGDYIGRTLDVFISKLRKKLEADPQIKIANIRGVGYKLVIN